MTSNINKTKEELSFSQWHETLNSYAKGFGGSAADEDAWRDDYELGRTPKQAWFDAWGEE